MGIRVAYLRDRDICGPLCLPGGDTVKAILTKYKGPTNFKGSRIIADDGDGNRLTISFPSELNHDDAHRKAAEALRDKMGRKGRLIGGGIKCGMAWVFAE